MTASRKRLVIYTVLTGAKEPLGNPLEGMAPGVSSDIDIDFVCFTDNRQLKSEVWTFHYLDRVPLPAEKLSRRPKAMPHDYLQDWDYSLYVDNIVVFKRLPCAADLATEADYLFKVYKHATRSHPREEAQIIVRLGYEKAERISTQLDFYQKLLPVESITPLSTCTVILRQHNHPAVVEFGVIWWEQILNFCKRDQMSFDFSVKWSGARLEHLPGLKHDNDLIQNTANIQPNRVHASFDALKYAWAHRSEPAALKDPRQHYLDHGRHEGKVFASRLEWAEYLSYSFGSSLGGQVSPRREIAGNLQDILQSRAALKGRLLIVRITDDGPTAFDAKELDAAERVIGTLLLEHRGTRLELPSSDLAKGNLAFHPPDGLYDVALVLGLPGALLSQAYKLVAPAIAPQAGLLCVLATGACRLADMAQVDAALAAHGPVSSSVHASRHDSLDSPIANSLLAFDWQAA